MINPYAASRLPVAVNDLVLPNDTVPNRLIVSFHMYVPVNFALLEANPDITWDRNNPAHTRPIMDGFDFIHNKFARNGIPVILGEFGVTDKIPPIQNENARAEWERNRADWAEFHIRYANSLGIKCFYWDDGGNISIFNRNEAGRLLVRHQHILDALMRGLQ
jgi:endoglucanase